MSFEPGPGGSATSPCPDPPVADRPSLSNLGANSALSGSFDSSRWRDLFPLPHANEPPRSLHSSVSSRRRRSKVTQLVQKSNEVIDVLNEIYAPPSGRSFLSTCSLAQQQSQHMIFQQLSKMGPATKPCTAREAVEELLRSCPTYSSEELSTTVRTFDKDLVSIPTSQSEPIELSGVLDPCGRETIEDPSRCMMLTEAEWGQMVEQGHTIKPYMDTKLQSSAQEYQTFVKALYDAGMISFTSDPQDIVTPFFVAKKDGRQRLILDCRGVNQRFRAPPSISLAAGYTWSHVQIPKNKNLYVAQSDIKDYFYHLKMPDILQPLFCMPSIPSALLRRWMVAADRGGEVNREGQAFPMLRVVPMGWSWAMWIAQRVHQFQCLVASGLPPSRIMTDRRPVPSLETDEPFVLPYADNLNVGGTNQSKVQAVKDKVVKHLRDIGFKVHEELDATTMANSLGYQIDGELGTVQPIPDKLRKVQLCLQWLARRPKISGKAVEKILGHMVHFTLIRRELLSLFRNLYDFAHTYSGAAHRMWRSAAREARWAAVLLNLCVADLRKEWDTVVTASDASLSGIAVCKRSADLETVQKIGSQKEGWRFSSYDPTTRPREQTVEKKDVFADPDTVKPLRVLPHDPFCFNSEFVEIEESFMDPSFWQLQYNVHMQIPEHITLLEGRGIVSALRHKLRDVNCFNKRHLHLGDNLASILIAEKGRSSSYDMLRVTRRLTALLLASSCILAGRWIPSEWNVADHGSRRWEAERKAQVSSKRQAQEVREALLYPKRGAAQTSSRRIARQSEATNALLTAKILAGEEQGGETVEESQSHGAVAGPTALSRTELPGTDGGLPCGGAGLSSTIPGLSEILSGPSFGFRKSQELRQCLERVSQQHVCRRQRHQRSNQGVCSKPGCQPRLFQQDLPPALPEEPTRLDKVGSWQHSPSSGLASRCSALPGPEQKRKTPRSFGVGPDVHRVPEARRSLEHQRRRPGGSKFRIGLPCHQPSPSRKTRSVKSWPHRRDYPSGFKNHAQSGLDVGKASDKKPSASLAGPRLPGPEGCLGRTTAPRRHPSKLHGVVSTPPFRTFSRQASQPQIPSGSEKKGPLGQRFFNETLRSPCKSPTRIPEVECPDTGQSLGQCRQIGEGAPKVFWPAPKNDKGQWVIEIFAGTCHLAKAAARAGYRAIAYDVLFGSSCDLLDPAVSAAVLHFASCHDVKLVWFGMPCQSWSRARKHDGGPKPLRDEHDFLWGKVDVGPKDRSKIILGNQLLLITVALIHQLWSLSIPWALENPWTSRCWLVSPIRDLATASGASLRQLDYCQYNMPWRKSTGILFAGCDLHSIFKTCQGSFGRCSATHKKHFALSGQDSAGKWLTHRAQPYPPLLCTTIISALDN